MDIYFKSRKLEKACSVERDSIRTWGADRARVVRRRLAELAAADNLAVVSTVPPPRLHALGGDRNGQFAVDAIHPFRLIFEPWHEEVSRLADGRVDKAKITAIRILEVEDYHGR